MASWESIFPKSLGESCRFRSDREAFRLEADPEAPFDINLPFFSGLVRRGREYRPRQRQFSRQGLPAPYYNCPRLESDSHGRISPKQPTGNNTFFQDPNNTLGLKYRESQPPRDSKKQNFRLPDPLLRIAESFATGPRGLENPSPPGQQSFFRSHGFGLKYSCIPQWDLPFTLERALPIESTNG